MIDWNEGKKKSSGFNYFRKRKRRRRESEGSRCFHLKVGPPFFVSYFQSPFLDQLISLSPKRPFTSLNSTAAIVVNRCRTGQLKKSVSIPGIKNPTIFLSFHPLVLRSRGHYLAAMTDSCFQFLLCLFFPSSLSSTSSIIWLYSWLPKLLACYQSVCLSVCLYIYISSCCLQGLIWTGSKKLGQERKRQRGKKENRERNGGGGGYEKGIEAKEEKEKEKKKRKRNRTFVFDWICCLLLLLFLRHSACLVLRWLCRRRSNTTSTTSSTSVRLPVRLIGL